MCFFSIGHSKKLSLSLFPVVRGDSLFTSRIRNCTHQGYTVDQFKTLQVVILPRAGSVAAAPRSSVALRDVEPDPCG